MCSLRPSRPGCSASVEEGGRNAGEIATACGFEPAATARFLDALCTLRLLARHAVREGAIYFNTKVASDYLVAGKAEYQGKAILWRKELVGHWSTLGDCLKAGRRVLAVTEEWPDEQSARIGKYLEAMDCAAREKAKEMMPFFEGTALDGEMLDVGAGSGGIALSFLDVFPALSATLIDIPEVLTQTQQFVAESGLGERVSLLPVNILEPWPCDKGRFNLVMLSNIIHAYSEKELPHILREAASVLSEGGMLVIHDFFFDHYPEKAAFFDINMFINTYNGRVFPGAKLREELAKLGLHATDLTPLGSDTAVIMASSRQDLLDGLNLDEKATLTRKIKALGFKHVVPVATHEISVPDWVQSRCEFGCDRFGSPGCPPNAPTPEKTRRLIGDYSFALLLEGEPPTREFQRLTLAAEREAFVTGYYKALALWAGPCSLCPACVTDGRCRNRKDCRPSMEGAGIDVFETVHRAGLPLTTLRSKDLFVKYFGLLLVE